MWHGLGPLFEPRAPARLTGINRAGGRSAGAREPFPLAVTLVVGTPVPLATPLIGMPMLGRLMKESGVVERLTRASSGELADVVTLFLGMAIGPTMVDSGFLTASTLTIRMLGILAFALDAVTGMPLAPMRSRCARLTHVKAESPPLPSLNTATVLHERAGRGPGDRGPRGGGDAEPVRG